MVALTGNTDAKIDGRKYSQLPKGMSRWSAQMPTETGSETGTATFHINFNPNSNVDFQRYVSLHLLTMNCGGVALVIKSCQVLSEPDEWEDYPVVRSLEAFNMRNVIKSTDYAGHTHQGPFYLGRSIKGSQARIKIVMQEINLTTYVISASGLISDKPFIAPYALWP